MHLPIKRASGRQRGDTMVEVLIAIAVVSLILGGAYVTTNKSLQATRAAQERSVALKLAESQIERLKGLVESQPDLIFGPAAPNPFCISMGTGEPVIDTHDDCAVNNTGAATDTEPIYHLTIAKTGNLFVLTETWTNVSGKVEDSLNLRYRVYE